jgi:hypothetical protein
MPLANVKCACESEMNALTVCADIGDGAFHPTSHTIAFATGRQSAAKREIGNPTGSEKQKATQNQFSREWCHTSLPPNEKS